MNLRTSHIKSVDPEHELEAGFFEFVEVDDRLSFYVEDVPFSLDVESTPPWLRDGEVDDDEVIEHRDMDSFELLLASEPLADYQRPCLSERYLYEVVKESYVFDADINQFVEHDNGDPYSFTQDDRRIQASITY